MALPLLLVGKCTTLTNQKKDIATHGSWLLSKGETTSSTAFFLYTRALWHVWSVQLVCSAGCLVRCVVMEKAESQKPPKTDLNVNIVSRYTTRLTHLELSVNTSTTLPLRIFHIPYSHATATYLRSLFCLFVTVLSVCHLEESGPF